MSKDHPGYVRAKKKHHIPLKDIFYKSDTSFSIKESDGYGRGWDYASRIVRAYELTLDLPNSVIQSHA